MPEVSESSQSIGKLRAGRVALSARAIAGLNAERALAAVYVVIHHLAHYRGWTHGLGMIFRFGQEAVIAFFILSGFVIFANERERGLKTHPYFQRRLVRIYPALICSMIVSTIVAALNGSLISSFHWGELLSTLASVEDLKDLKPGVISAPFLGNDPLWSLSYEVAFYAAFPVLLRFWRARPTLTTHLVGATSVLASCGFSMYPNHFLLVWSYFIIWWAGAMAASVYSLGKRTCTALAPEIGWLLLQCVVYLLVLFNYKGDHNAGVYPGLILRHFGVAALMLVIGFSPIGAAICSFSLRFRRLVGGIASISFGIYIVHYPIVLQSGLGSSLVGLAVALAVTLFVSWFIDKWLSDFMKRSVGRFSSS